MNLEDIKINVKIKLAALWATVMFIYVYVDIFGFYRPGIIEEIIAGEVAGIQINQVFLLGALILMIIPSLMVFLSLALPAKVNRWTNIIVGIAYIVVVLSFIPGETYAFYIFGSILEVVLLLLVVWHAWKWPRPKKEG